MPANEHQETGGIGPGEQAVPEENAAFARGGPVGGRERHAEQAPDFAAYKADGSLAKIGNGEEIAEQIIAIELDKRIHVEARLKGRGAHYDQGEVIDDGLGIGDPPEEAGDGPEGELEISAGEADPETMRLFGEKPGIADVAIKGGLEVDEHEPHLAHGA